MEDNISLAEIRSFPIEAQRSIFLLIDLERAYHSLRKLIALSQESPEEFINIANCVTNPLLSELFIKYSQR
jgi:hypothetical protein